MDGADLNIVLANHEPAFEAALQTGGFFVT